MCTSSTSRRHRLARIFAFLGLAAVAIAVPLGACSLGTSPIDGIVDAEGGITYLGPTGDQERPGTYRWLRFASGGAFRGEREIVVPWADVHLRPLMQTADDRLWLRVGCSQRDRRAHCHTIQEVLSDGTLGRRWPLALGSGSVLARDDQLRFATLDGGTLWFFEIDLETGEPRLLRRAAIGDRYPLDAWRMAWGLGPDGDLVLAFASSSETVRIVRVDAEDREIARVDHPAARFGFDVTDDDGIRRLGPIHQIVIGEDGLVMAYQSDNDPSCAWIQPPSIVLFDRDLARLGIADNEVRIASFRRVGSALVVVSMYGSVRRFDLDGTEIERWAPDVPPLPSALGPPVPTFDSWEAMQAAARALTQDAPLTHREVLHEVADSAKQDEIDGWWVEEGPATYAAFGDDHWQRLAAAFCARHPREAPAEALRRYSRSRGRAQTAWLPAVVGCFEAPLPQILAHAERLAASRQEKGDAVVYEAWGYPRAQLDALWRTVLETPLVRGNEVIHEALRLLRAFPQVADDFDRLVTTGDENARMRVERMLIESVELWGRHHTFRVDATVTRARRALLETAEGWLEHPSRDVRTLAHILRFGHDEAHVDLGARGAELVAFADESPRFWPAVAWAFDQAIADEEAFAHLNDATVIALVDASARRHPPTPLMLSHSATNPWRFLLHAGGGRSLEKLVSRTFDEDTSPAARKRLLQRLAERPWMVEPTSMRRLLTAPWIDDEKLFPQALIVRLGSVARPGGRLQATLVGRFEARALSKDSRGADHLARHLGDVRHGGLQGSPLIDAVGAAGIARIYDTTSHRYRWTRAIAQVGPWPEAEETIDTWLAKPHASIQVEAAAALASRRHPTAFTILEGAIERGLDEPFEIAALAHYGEQARPAIERLLHHERPALRMRGRWALRALGPSEVEVAALAADAETTYQDGGVPDVATMLMLHEAGCPALSRWLDALRNAPEHALDDVERFIASHDVRSAVLGWLRAAMESEVPSAVHKHLPFASPEALRWLDALESVFDDSQDE